MSLIQVHKVQPSLCMLLLSSFHFFFSIMVSSISLLVDFWAHGLATAGHFVIVIGR